MIGGLDGIVLRVPRERVLGTAGRACAALHCAGGVGKCLCVCETRETNLQNKGLISVDRSNKATLLLTIPRSLFKSSAKDLSPPIFEIVISYDTGRS